MSVFLLPLATPYLNSSFNTVLDGVTYGFEFRWNARDAAWYATILTGEGVVVVAGIKVVVDLPLFIRNKSALLPPGKFLALDTSGAHLDPGIDDLGTRVQLSYLDTDE